MLPAKVRYQLHFGPYRTPRFKVGSVVQDKVRGRVKIIGVSNGRIPWPVAMNWTHRSLVVYRGLSRALRLETLQAVAYWWGVSGEQIRILRRALGIPIFTAGTALAQSGTLGPLPSAACCAKRGRTRAARRGGMPTARGSLPGIALCPKVGHLRQR